VFVLCFTPNSIFRKQIWWIWALVVAEGLNVRVFVTQQLDIH